MPSRDVRAGAGARIAAAIDAAREAHRLPGLALCAARGGDVLLETQRGLADLEAEVPVGPDTVFEIASITKLFTTVLTLQLVDEGAWALETPLGEALPDLPEAWRGVPLGAILAHQSGLPSYTDAPGYWDGTALDRGRRGILALVEGAPPAFAPGERFAYDNTGFYLLGMALERRTGRAWATLLRERVTGPLGLGATRPNVAADLVPRRARGYTVRGDGSLANRPPYSPDNTFSAGDLLANARDVARFGAALVAGTGDDPPAGDAGASLLPAALRRAMLVGRPSRRRNEDALGYRIGLGWHLIEVDGRAYAGHNGSILGFGSSLTCDPASGTSVAILLNADGWAAPHELGLRVLRELDGFDA